MVSVVALVIAVPMGVGAAIYVNQVATATEQRFIKPCIEFISAFPSVVLGFFGIAVLGQAMRLLSQQSWLAWVPGFPYSERLNILTAGCLLALITVPTIFTLAEDALNNVPRAYREASLALGATRLQTVVRIVVPASLSGIVAAILLGLGRVIGETMVVLLCAGNRIAIPDFSAGLAVFTQPVHTMTGIIAQEMGEVVRGSIHYRALFMVGLVLFLLSLLINFLAQKIVRRYRVPVG
jgi:phosphate transport system permease protein